MFFFCLFKSTASLIRTAKGQFYYFSLHNNIKIYILHLICALDKLLIWSACLVWLVGWLVCERESVSICVCVCAPRVDELSSQASKQIHIHTQPQEALRQTHTHTQTNSQHTLTTTKKQLLKRASHSSQIIRSILNQLIIHKLKKTFCLISQVFFFSLNTRHFHSNIYIYPIPKILRQRKILMIHTEKNLRFKKVVKVCPTLPPTLSEKLRAVSLTI